MTRSPRPACEMCTSLHAAQEALSRAIFHHEAEAHPLPPTSPETGARRLRQAADEALPQASYYGMPLAQEVVSGCAACQDLAESFYEEVAGVVERQSTRQFDDLAKVRVHTALARHRKHVIAVHPQVWLNQQNG